MDNNKLKNLYTKKKIFYIRLELIKDFLFSLLDNIERTFLGDDLMSITNKKEHLEYCVDLVINSFEAENIHIKKDKKFLTFIFNIYFPNYYDAPKTKKTFEEFKIKISNTLSYSETKSEASFKDLAQYYEIFNESLGDFLAF